MGFPAKKMIEGKSEVVEIELDQLLMMDQRTLIALDQYGDVWRAYVNPDDMIIEWKQFTSKLKE